MNIQYEVLEHEGETAKVRITPEKPINGFYGCELCITRNTDKESDETPENFIEKRVTWKVRQEVGASNVLIVKV